MTKPSTIAMQRSLREVIADDSHALTFQTSGQYRAALLKHEPMEHTHHAEAYAWAVFTKDDNVIIWSKNRAQVESASKEYGRPIVPVIALFTAQQAAAPGAPEALQTAAERDVLAERQRQVQVEGWTTEHDDKYSNCDLARAAATYALCSHIEQLKLCGAQTWPWHPDWWKRSSYRRDLVKAGALLLAEIERLDHAAQLDGVQDGPLSQCAAGRDGECDHKACPQLRDKEPATSGRHCPLDSHDGGE